MKSCLLCFMPLVFVAADIQIPGRWALLSQGDESAQTEALPPAVPRKHSGQQATLVQTKVRAADGALITKLKDLPGVRIEGGEVSLSYGTAKEADLFAPMASPPGNGAEWYGSTYWTGGEPWARVGRDWMHPGNAIDVARVFIAPVDGRVSVSGVVRKLHLDGDGVKVSVHHNHREVWAAELQGEDAVGKEAAITLEVNKGNALRFMVNRRGGHACDTTGWDPVVTYAGGPVYRASEGFSEKQGASGWRYECSGATVMLARKPEVYGVGKDFRIFKGVSDTKGVFPFVIVSDGNREDGYGGYVIALETDGAWALTQETDGLKVSGSDVATVVRYDGTWIEGLKLLAEISSRAGRIGPTKRASDMSERAGFEKLGASVRAAYQLAVAGVPRAPELGLFLLAVSEWVQDDGLFGGGDPKRLAKCVQEQVGRAERIQVNGMRKGWNPRSLSGWPGYLQARLMKRSTLLADSRLGFGKILFCKRRNPSWNHEVAQYFGWRQRPGGSLYVLERPGVSLACRDLVDGRLPQGNFLEPRLSYDAKKILFSFVETDGALDPRSLPRNETDTNHHYFHIYEIDSDGAGVRQITNDIYNDLMPTWLPDGGIVFVSTLVAHSRAVSGGVTVTVGTPTRCSA